jgi:hypothetical protein
MGAVKFMSKEERKVTNYTAGMEHFTLEEPMNSLERDQILRISIASETVRTVTESQNSLVTSSESDYDDEEAKRNRSFSFM